MSKRIEPLSQEDLPYVLTASDRGINIGTFRNKINELVDAVNELQDSYELIYDLHYNKRGEVNMDNLIKAAKEVASVLEREENEPRYTVAELRTRLNDFHNEHPIGPGTYVLPEHGFLDWLQDNP